MTKKATKKKKLGKFYLKKKYVVSLLILAGISLFGIVLSLSYAFFTTRVESSDLVFNVGTLQINYTDGNVINLTTEYPKTNAQGLSQEGYSFNITNTGSIDAKYLIRLELDPTNTLPLEYVKLSYIKTKENNNNTDTPASDPILVSNLNATQTFITNQVIESGKTDGYNLKLWIDYSAPNSIQGKTFKAKIVVDAIQNVEDGYAMANTIPIITLDKYENGEIDAHLKVNENFTDPGIESVKDEKDKLTQADVTVTYKYTNDGVNLTTVNSVDTTTAGVYYIDYEVTDSDNLVGRASRVVTVNAVTTPTISLNGNNPMTIEQYSVFTDPGATVASGNHVAVIGEVKTSVPGTYIVRYIVIDSNGSVNSVTRTVTVQEKTVWNFAYDPDNDGEGQEQTFMIPVSGKYKLEVWGAEGASVDSTYYGGYGGYSVGILNATANENLYINVGGKGGNTALVKGDFRVYTGGYNGGGYAVVYPSNWKYRYLYAGGGATHIATESGLLHSLESYKDTGGTNISNEILIVAGGGGSASNQTNNGSYYSRTIGGSGGGFKGVDLILVQRKWTCGNETSSSFYSTAGSQTAGGIHVSCNNNPNTYGFNEYFGQGKVARNYILDSNNNLTSAVITGTASWGGGGGWYGGADGAGGSGYIASANLTSTSEIRKSMYCFGCTEALNTETDTNIFTVRTNGASEYRDTTNCPDGYSADPVAKCAKTGNGYARITYLGN